MLHGALEVCRIGSDSRSFVPRGGAGAIFAPRQKRTAFWQIPTKTAAARMNWSFAGSNPAVPVQTGIENAVLYSRRSRAFCPVSAKMKERCIQQIRQPETAGSTPKVHREHKKRSERHIQQPKHHLLSE